MKSNLFVGPWDFKKRPNASRIFPLRSVGGGGIKEDLRGEHSTVRGPPGRGLPVPRHQQGGAAAPSVGCHGQ